MTSTIETVSCSVERLTRPRDVTDWVNRVRARGESVGFVPTMGALHEGHLSLVRTAASECDQVVVSLFVNPTQFSPSEDFEKYPRDLEADRELLSDLGVDVLFAPTVEALYRPDDKTMVDVGPMTQMLEGSSRPTHFRGVTTIVAKLLGIVPADRMYLGQKDFQQTVVLRRMIRDLFLPVQVVVCPTVRESDGLAMSSRNAYLSPAERESALVLSRVLRHVASLVAKGERNVVPLREEAMAMIESEQGVQLDYLAFLAPNSVESVDFIETGAVVAIAAQVGKTRLIDNEILA